MKVNRLVEESFKAFSVLRLLTFTHLTRRNQISSQVCDSSKNQKSVTQLLSIHSHKAKTRCVIYFKHVSTSTFRAVLIAPGLPDY